MTKRNFYNCGCYVGYIPGSTIPNTVRLCTEHARAPSVAELMCGVVVEVNWLTQSEKEEIDEPALVADNG